ncbi:hypothetical protein [Flavobacterium sp.]|uniref:hypothetical protein n=1 Tax=Flavobacterium sp. TaxID=239 RepID=UPI004034E01A
MKKQYLITVLFFVTAFMAYSQTPAEELMFSRSIFNDAKDIQTTPAERDKILANYFDGNAEIQAFNKKYGFTLADFSVDPNGDKGRIKGMQDATIAGAQAGTLPGILNPALGVDALGSVIAERFKQEINIAFLKKFKEALENDEYHLGSLFPESKKVLLNSDPYNYPVFMNALKQAFRVDSQNLFITLPIVLKQYEATAGYEDQIMLLLRLSNSAIAEDIVRVVNDMAYNYNGNDSVLQKSLYGLALVFNAGNKNGSGVGMFMDKKDLAYFSGSTNSVFQEHYYALLYRQNEKYVEGLGIKKGDADKVKKLVTEAVREYQLIGQLASTLAAKNTTGKLEAIDVIKAAGDVSGSLKRIIALYKANIDTTVDAGNFEVALGYFDSVVKIARNIQQKDYGLALNELVQIIVIFFPADKDSEKFSRFKKYAGFIANALSADSKDDLMDALDTSANPVGSYRIKRNSTFNISINAYAGGFAGLGPDDATIYGFTAPVGIYAGWGNIGKNSENPLKGVDGKSFGLFLPLVDVGAVTAFRLQDDETEMADVSWGNVFAPGAYLTFGFGKCPISLNLGGQMGPELTKVNSDGTPEFVEKEWYWRAGIVVDISLFDLYTKQRAYKTDKKED